MDCNIKTEDKKVVMKLLNQYADSYQCLEKQNKVLQESIKDLKTNLKINKDIISNFLSKSTSTEINKSIIAKLNSQVESLTKSNEDLTKQKFHPNSPYMTQQTSLFPLRRPLTAFLLNRK